MEAYPNARWRESDYSNEMSGSSRSSPNQIYHSAGDPRLPDHKGRIGWQRNGSMSSPHSSWDSPGNWSPQSPVRRSPLLATPPENGYIYMRGKDDIHGSPYSGGHVIWRDHMRNREIKRPDDYRTDYPPPPLHQQKKPSRSHHQREFSSRSHYYDRSVPHMKYSSPTYSDGDATSLHPDMCHYNHHHSKNQYHFPSSYDSPPRDPRNRQRLSCSSNESTSKSHFSNSKKHINDKLEVSSQELPKKMPVAIPIGSNVTSLECEEEFEDKASRHNSIISKHGTVLKKSELSVSDNTKAGSDHLEHEDTFKVIKSVLLQRILLEHSYSKPLTVTDMVIKPLYNQTHHMSTSEPSTVDNAVTTVSEKRSEITLSSSEMVVNNDEGESMEDCMDCEELETDDSIAGDHCSPKSISLKGFSLDLDTEPTSSPKSVSSEQESPLLTVSIPLVLINQHPKSPNEISSLSVPPVSTNYVKKENICASHKGQPYYNMTVTDSQANTNEVKPEDITEDMTNVDMIITDEEIDKDLLKLTKRQASEESTASFIDTPRKRKVTKTFKDFVPEILETRSRAETATMRRRQVMVKEIETNESERKRTAVYSDLDNNGRLPSPSKDDSCSIISSSSISQSVADEFTPEFIQYCKTRYAVRSLGSGDSILHKVCRTGKTKAARYYILIEQVKVDSQDNAGWTPLHEACNNCYHDIVKLLLENGADPNLPSFDGTRPIHDAIEAGDISIVKLLVQHGADVMAEYSEKTPLELAKSHRQTEIAYYLEEVIEERKKKLAKKESVITPQVPLQPTYSSSKQQQLDYVTLPFDGYTTPMFGNELDTPYVYISAVIEESKKPLLPVFNIQVSGGNNPRRHNFHILADVLQHLNITKDELLSQVNISTYFISVTDLMQQLQQNPLTVHSTLIPLLKEQDVNSSIELIPLCNSLRQLCNIELCNIDDY